MVYKVYYSIIKPIEELKFDTVRSDVAFFDTPAEIGTWIAVNSSCNNIIAIHRIEETM